MEYVRNMNMKWAKLQEKEPPRMFPARRLYPINSDWSCNLVGTETTRTNINGFRSTVYHGFDSSDIGLPCSVGFSVGVGHIVTEHNTFSANTAFCHDSHTSCTELFRSARRFDGGECKHINRPSRTQVLLYHKSLGKSRAFFTFFKKSASLDGKSGNSRKNQMCAGGAKKSRPER